MYEPDTPAGVKEFCSKEGQPCESIDRLIETGDELARKLRSAPGIDPMRSAYLTDWELAKKGET